MAFIGFKMQLQMVQRFHKRHNRRRSHSCGSKRKPRLRTGLQGLFAKSETSENYDERAWYSLTVRCNCHTFCTNTNTRYNNCFRESKNIPLTLFRTSNVSKLEEIPYYPNSRGVKRYRVHASVV